ncbi:MAG: hypothetical protein GTN38_00935, partial [Candidatus Aenigmarchaeota archaeon]|nr:hypothetical protein [Candidatus Aenigmarchaeota archaeon]NIP40152.1 hypothetical protein [Candidatus Aenigmarchaeota archaeon]NIQ17196.1 hypothetical protein [Candidatus Aenigmarchaeota archaeon]NIS72986.1 hypothetical protein [Candidatus Aenigmarchaeota archaeon]
MEIETAGIITAFVLALLIIIVVGTTGFTGNVITDFSEATNPLSGLIIMLVFIIGALLVFRVFVPGSRSP